MKLTKQNKLYLGIAALGVVGYLIWKKTQNKKQFLKVIEPRPNIKERYRLLSDHTSYGIDYNSGGDYGSRVEKLFRKGQIVSGRPIQSPWHAVLFVNIGGVQYDIPMSKLEKLRDKRDIININQSIGNKKMFVEDNMIIQSSNWE